MRHALAGQDERVLQEMSDFWRRNGGMSRFAKLQHFFTQIAPHPDVAGQLEVAALRFGEDSRAGYDDCAPLAPALRVAEVAGAERCHVVSGAAQSERPAAPQASVASATLEPVIRTSGGGGLRPAAGQ